MIYRVELVSYHVGFWGHIGNFFYSNLFVGLVALLVGIAAYRVYYKRKHDEKRDAASILFLEIQGAEDALTKVSVDKPISDIDDPDIFLMKTASWDKYRHLFVKDFENINEFNKITEFYDKCKEYDDAVRLRNSSFYHNQKVLRSNAHNALRRYLEQYIEDTKNMTDQSQLDVIYNKYLAKRQLFKDQYLNSSKAPEIFTYMPSQPFNNAKRVLGTIDRNLSTSIAGEVLKNLANPKHFINFD